MRGTQNQYEASQIVPQLRGGVGLSNTTSQVASTITLLALTRAELAKTRSLSFANEQTSRIGIANISFNHRIKTI